MAAAEMDHQGDHMYIEPIHDLSPKSAMSSPIVDGIEALEVPTEPLWEDDGDSAVGDYEDTTSTISLTDSILEYRQIHGRTYHSDKHGSFYWGPNDERSQDVQDIGHEVFLCLHDGKLFLAPLDTDRVQKVLDVGTGTGMWANDFADQYPNAEVIGTDISPMQPAWTAPNCRFEMEDAEQEWTFEPESFDYIHIRTLQGSIKDWPRLFRQCYVALKPGGWIESYETDGRFLSDDHTIPDDSPLKMWTQYFKQAGTYLDRSFSVVEEDLQREAIEAAGFKDIHVKDMKSPIGPWSSEPRLRKSGIYAHISFDQDLEGYLTLVWSTVLHKPIEEMHVFLAHFRKALRTEKMHIYLPQKIVYAQKPR